MAEEWVNFWGLIAGAVIGAFALYFIAKITATQVQGNFKAEKLAEAKRDIYLDLVDSWMNYLLDINSFRMNSTEEYWHNAFQANKELVSSLHRSSFISEPKTKLAVMDLTFDLALKHRDICDLVDIWYKVETNRHGVEGCILKITDDLANKAQKLQIALRDELGIKNDQAIDVEIIEMRNTFVKSSKLNR